MWIPPHVDTITVHHSTPHQGIAAGGQSLVVTRLDFFRQVAKSENGLCNCSGLWLSTVYTSLGIQVEVFSRLRPGTLLLIVETARPAKEKSLD